MKSILFMIIDMNIGGTEKALLTMLTELPAKKYNITVLMLNKEGGFLEYIPKNVTVRTLGNKEYIKEIINTPPKNIIKQLIKRGKLGTALGVSYNYLISKLMTRRDIYYKYMLKEVEAQNDYYDVAVAYAGPMEFISYYISNKVRAKKKLQWIHFDINKIGFDKVFSQRVYKNFDKIFCVSKEGKNKLVEAIPELEEKTEVFLNIISSNLINKQSEIGDTFNDKFDGIRILTVGRLCDQKGQDLAIRLAERLLRDGFNIKWYCIGEGINKEKYLDMISKFKIQNKFILLGSTSNPYRYIKDCDIYVQPSRHEGYCTTVTEAKILNKPMVITEVNGSREQIKSDYNGIIADINEEKLYVAIKKIIQDEELRKNFEKNLKSENIDTKKQIENLINIIEE